jgi:hypothetical protein
MFQNELHFRVCSLENVFRRVLSLPANPVGSVCFKRTSGIRCKLSNVFHIVRIIHLRAAYLHTNEARRAAKCVPNLLQSGFIHFQNFTALDRLSIRKRFGHGGIDFPPCYASGSCEVVAVFAVPRIVSRQDALEEVHVYCGVIADVADGPDLVGAIRKVLHSRE